MNKYMRCVNMYKNMNHLTPWVLRIEFSLAGWKEWEWQALQGVAGRSGERHLQWWSHTTAVQSGDGGCKHIDP